MKNLIDWLSSISDLAEILARPIDYRKELKGFEILGIVEHHKQGAAA